MLMMICHFEYGLEKFTLLYTELQSMTIHTQEAPKRMLCSVGTCKLVSFCFQPPT